MLTRNEEKHIQSLHSKKGRRESGECLVEGEKFIAVADTYILRTFGPEDSDRYDHLVTTETPQDRAAIARIPVFSLEDLLLKRTILVLDGVQDPGNVGAVLRLASAFDAAVVLIESADPSSSKVIRSSAGHVFLVPWMEVPRAEAVEFLSSLALPVFRLEKTPQATAIETLREVEKVVLIAGNEGSGVQLPIDAPSVFIPHHSAVDSLNVGHAVAIALYIRQ